MHINCLFICLISRKYDFISYFLSFNHHFPIISLLYVSLYLPRNCHEHIVLPSLIIPPPPSSLPYYFSPLFFFPLLIFLPFYYSADFLFILPPFLLLFAHFIIRRPYYLPPSHDSSSYSLLFTLFIILRPFYYSSVFLIILPPSYGSSPYLLLFALLVILPSFLLFFHFFFFRPLPLFLISRRPATCNDAYRQNVIAPTMYSQYYAAAGNVLFVEDLLVFVK